MKRIFLFHGGMKKKALLGFFFFFFFSYLHEKKKKKKKFSSFLKNMYFSKIFLDFIVTQSEVVLLPNASKCMYRKIWSTKLRMF